MGPRRTRGHHPRRVDPGIRAAADLIQRTRSPRRRHRRGCPAPRGYRRRRHLPRSDRGRQPQRDGRPAGGRGVRGAARHRQDQRPRARRRVRRARYLDALSDRLDDRRDECAARVPALRVGGDARAERSPPGRGESPPARIPGSRDDDHARPDAGAGCVDGGVDRVRIGRRRGEGRVLPGQGAARLGPRSGVDGEGSRSCPADR